MEGVGLNRNVAVGRHRLLEIVSGLERSPAIERLLGGPEACQAALEKAEVELMEDWGYMWVSNDDGTLHISAPYWREGEELHLYLDLVHEFVHVKQHHDGRDLFDRTYKYVERPTEVEAYRVAVEEARRLGMTDEDLFEFLYVEWISHEDHRQLCDTLGVKLPSSERKAKERPGYVPRDRPPTKAK